MLWVLPIYWIEREFKRQRGLDALEERFEERSIDYLDPFRSPVVSPPEVDSSVTSPLEVDSSDGLVSRA